jgi:hypothetical protein
MTCKTVDNTNQIVEMVATRIESLIGYAEADAQHARESDAPETARDDMWRAQQLHKALRHVRECKR